MSVLHDLKFGLRLLRRAPGFTAVAIASLATGLGCAVALFTVMNGVLLRPVAGHDTHDVQRVYTSESDGDRYGGSSLADFRSFTGASGIFAAACATTDVRSNLVLDGISQGAPGAVVTGGCFSVFGVRPHLGRVLSAADESAPAVVLGHNLWRRVFKGDAAVVGRTGLLNGVSVVIVGVAEPGFSGVSFDGGEEFWASSSLAAQLLAPTVPTSRTARWFNVYARLAPGVSAIQASERLNVMAAGLHQEDPRAWAAPTGSPRVVTVVSEVQARFASSGGEAAAIGFGMLAAIALVVGLSCLNLAVMIMARGASRTRELTVRLALGASRGRLLRQLATESLIISASGVAVGLAVVAAALRLVDVYRPPELPSVNLAIDRRVLTFGIVIALVTPIVFGVAPGLRAIRLAISDGVKGAVGHMRRGWLRLNPREALIVVQVTVAFAAFITAALFVSGITDSSNTAPVPTRDIAVAAIDLNTLVQTPSEATAVSARILDVAARVPGVAAVTAAGVVPMTGSYLGFNVRDGDRPSDPLMTVDGNLVTPGYFDLGGIARRAGRVFDDSDHATAPPVVVVSESLARQVWGTTVVVGRRLWLSDRLREVVGVVADVPYRSLTRNAHPIVYLPFSQSTRQRFVLHSRVGAGAETMAALDRALRGVDARVIVGPVRPLTALFDEVQVGARVVQWAAIAAGSWQLALTLMAIWGLVAYAVERRTAEIALRRALGASERDVLGMIMRPSLWLMAIGGALGSGIGALGATAMHVEFLGLRPFEFAVIVPALAVLVPVVAAAAWVPGRRAVAIEPAHALKQS